MMRYKTLALVGALLSTVLGTAPALAQESVLKLYTSRQYQSDESL